MAIHLKDYYYLLALLTISLIIENTRCQLVNRAPHFLLGNGDMSRFTISENTQVGSPVYQLKGEDPEGSKLHYSISGQYFMVDKYTGVVTLIKPLDREKEDTIEVIISVTDESVGNIEPNTISLRREIPVIDFNDNPPVFRGRPYSAMVSEAEPQETEIQIVPEIIVTDKDGGGNANIQVECYSKENLGDREACDVFHIRTEKLVDGQFMVKVSLKRQLDYETRSTYRLGLKARDGAPENELTALATVSIDVIDVQDQPPLFINSPYSATVPENTPTETSIMEIMAKDGDTGDSRMILLTLEGDVLGYFDLVPKSKMGEAILITTSFPIDREHPYILQNGGVYSFFVKATELINGEIPSDYSVTQVTIVVTDADDHLPVFNQNEFNVSIPENIKTNTLIPGLSIYVDDSDLGINSRYNLSIRNVLNSENVFTVSPFYGEGRTPIAIKVKDALALDYDISNTSKRSLNFDVIASVSGEEVASTRVNIKLLDTNDNSPTFEMESYKVTVLENAKEGVKIFDLQATDKDSGAFGKLEYSLTGFGADYFKTDKTSGGLYVNRPLDYEKQKSYSLTMVAKDGGGKLATVNVFVELEDVNDNAPIFEKFEYMRTIRDGATEFEPQLVVRANDKDGPDQGGNEVSYSIISDNSLSRSGDVFSIDSITGEIKINNNVDSMDTPRGQYEIVIRATDKGIPPQHNETRVYIRVGVPGNQRPIFKGNYNSFTPPRQNDEQTSYNSIDFTSFDFSPMNYKASVMENAVSGTNITTVSANDPDGLDYHLTYHIVGGARDNFVIDERSGLITVSSEARLDKDSNPHYYDVIVTAVDNGTPVPETATTTVFISVNDINDKPPIFNQTNTSAYISERTKIGKSVFKAEAVDSDDDSNIVYSISTPIKAFSKSGVQLKSIKPYNYKTAFRIDENSGEIIVNNTLDYNQASIIILPIKAEDINAEYNKDKQFATTDITFYIQPFTDNTPQFTNEGWTSLNPKIFVDIDEEEPIGSTLFVLSAEDPTSGHIVTNYKVINSETDLLQVDPQSGQVLLTKKLDYESLENPELSFTVKATSNDGSKYSTAMVIINVQNINDNPPEFKLKQYKTSVAESSKYPERILKVEAIDMDAVLNNIDKSKGYSDIEYSLGGQNADLFIIDKQTGVIQIAPNKTLDREKQSALRLEVIATDSPSGSRVDQLKTTVPLIIDVLDVNDNHPKFERPLYVAVVPENVNIGRSVITVNAIDPDEGLGGEIKYEFVDEGEANGLFSINSLTGEVRTRLQLSGKGRALPYIVRIGAVDGGSLHGQCDLSIYIGDVSANDGVPKIIEPSSDKAAFISENATIGSTVYQVVASDPDDPTHPSGQLSYKLQETYPNSQVFHIDSKTGLITTKKLLDREKTASYELIILVSDKGEPPQKVSRVLQVNLIDVDDHKPRFIRTLNDPPITFNVKEEQPLNTEVAEISAVDEDIGENGAVDYMFIAGNELGIFNLTRTEDNKAKIYAINRLDREMASHHLLSIRCFKYGQHPPNNPYNRLDPSDVQVLIKVVDIDDHLPEFSQKNFSVGVRLNVPTGTTLVTVSAVDKDSSALPIRYSLNNITFISPIVGRKQNASGLFLIDKETGDISSTKSLVHFADGSFSMIVRANNSKESKRHTDTNVQIFVVRDRDLLRFVFRSPPSDVRRSLPQFSSEISSLFMKNGYSIHIFDTQVLSEADNTLDFSSTSSCFQMSKGYKVLNPNEMMEILDKTRMSDETGERLAQSYATHKVSTVENCAPLIRSGTAAIASASQLWLLILSAILVVAAIVATCSVCCLHSKYKRKTKRLVLSRVPPPASSMSIPRIYSEPYYST